jgi:hypothetical protein
MRPGASFVSANDPSTALTPPGTAPAQGNRGPANGRPGKQREENFEQPHCFRLNIGG